MSKKQSPGLISQAEYARHRGKSRQYIGRLAKASVLVMRHGKVDVGASDAVLDDRPVAVEPGETPPSNQAQAATIALEIGDIARFPSAERLASYSGTTPRVHASGGKVRYGKLRPDVNRYLKWAFVEAANSVAVNYARCSQRHVSRLYARLRQRKGHSKAIGALARHWAEAAFHVLHGQQPYRDPAGQAGSTREG